MTPTLTEHDERLLVGVSIAADRRRLARVARVVLDRGDAVTALLRAAGDVGGEGYEPAWRLIGDVVGRRGGIALNLLDLAVEVGQQELERRGKPRTWAWPS